MSHDQVLEIALHGDPIDAFAAIRDLRTILKQAEHDHVMTLRRHGASWAFIANHLGVSRQAANAAYAPWEPPTPT
ncbi:MAG TPA: RNA polymerase subunit sigma-70 [Mycobacterium sp.]|nr:RNA polymerase subunit sigma-70 [Mycobacterium sp.]